MVLGDGGAMKSGVKVGLFLKKHPVGSKGAELALLCLHHIYQISTIFTFKVLQQFIAWASDKTKFPKCNIFF